VVTSKAPPIDTVGSPKSETIVVSDVFNSATVDVTE
jgi:hypothetical protein